MSPARIAAGLMMVFVAAASAAVAIPLLHSVGRSSPETPPANSGPPLRPPQLSASQGETRFGIICDMAGNDDYCPRLTDTILRRTVLTATEYAAAETISEQITKALPPGVDQEPSCELVPGSRPKDGETLDEVCSVEVLPPPVPTVRRALAAIGHPDAIVRTALPEDPAPTGSVLVAVPAGPACILLIHRGSDRTSTVGGRLPDGSCL